MSTALKDAVDALSKILEMVLGTIGAVAAYRRFFKGRVLEPRVKLSLSSEAIRWVTSLSTDGRSLLHSIDVEIENVGGATVWDPEVKLRTLAIDSDSEIGVLRADPGIEREPSVGELSGIGPGEVVVYHYDVCVPRWIQAFRASAEVWSGGHVWQRARTLANAISPSDDPARG
jgi:hypothetical protein